MYYDHTNMSSLYLKYLNLKQAILRECDHVISWIPANKNSKRELSEQEAERPLKKRWKGVRGLDGDVN